MIKKCIYFIAGAAAFGISQLILRIPLLNLAQTTTAYIWLSITAPFILSWLIAFSAGLFEETGRLWLMKLSLKITGKSKFYLSDAIVFGLGHGLLEAFWILSKTAVYIRLYGFDINAAMSIFERVFAVIFHVALSVFVAMAVNLKKCRWYMTALAAHTVLDGIIVYFSSPLILEICFGLIGLTALTIAIILFYRLQGGKNYA